MSESEEGTRGTLAADLTRARWRKSSRSANGSECVEVAAVPTWRTSSYTANGANCVEVAGVGSGAAVRDSKDRSGPALAFARREWAAFLSNVKTGTFDQA